MDATPTLEPGLALLEQPDRGALHRLVLEHEVDRRETSKRASSAELRSANHSSGLRGGEAASNGTAEPSPGPREDGGAASRDTGGETLWVDAGGAASTYGLTAAVPTRRALRGIRIARAFTAHQHHQLVRNAVAEASDRTGLVVAPNVATLYDVDDAPAAELDRLFEASIALLSDLANALSVPVLVSAPRASDGRLAIVADRAAYEIGCEATDLGYAYDADGFDQHGYWGAGWWQTTVPYWVEVCGAGPPVGAALDAAGLLGIDGPTTPDAVPGIGVDRQVDRSRIDRTQAEIGGW